MIPGNNELLLNEAAIIQAVQLWADATFKEPPKVTSVRQTKNGTYDVEFTVFLSEPTYPKEA